MNDFSYTYSITIAHYNSSKLLERMLQSIPERDDIQVIVVDDGSASEHVEKLKRLSHNNLELILLEKNSGCANARNVGSQHVKGKWLLAVDCDDVFTEDAFKILDKFKDLEVDYISYCVRRQNVATSANVDSFLKSDTSVRNYIKHQTHSTLMRYKFYNMDTWNKMISMDFFHKKIFIGKIIVVLMLMFYILF